MKEIDDMLDQTKNERQKRLQDIKATFEKMLKEPFDKF